MLASLREKKPFFFLCLLILLLFCLLLHPALAYASAKRGLALWWQSVAPALLPFFILSELLLELGAAAYLGPLLSPIMGPLFRLPGAGALAVAMGFCSGFPSGAAITAGLRREKAISAAQGERLAAFTNNAGPLYISVTVATGLLACPKAALLLALAHYGADLLLGLVLGWSAKLRGERLPPQSAPKKQAILPPQESLGSLLRNAAQKAAGNILLIGCYMVFFSVVTALLSDLLPPLPLLAEAWLLGSFEMSLGLDLLSRNGLPLAQLLPWAAAMLSFGGLSVQGQVLAMLAGTDIRPRLYLLCRPLQATLSYGIAALLCRGMELPTAAIPLIGESNGLPLLLASGILALAVTGLLFALARLRQE